MTSVPGVCSGKTHYLSFQAISYTKFFGKKVHNKGNQCIPQQVADMQETLGELSSMFSNQERCSWFHHVMKAELCLPENGKT